jgi:pre-rRNA-processing protein TSR3
VATPITTPPITILVVHPRENRAKCSLEPLRGRSDLRFVKFSPKLALELDGYVRLAVDGEPLTERDAERGLLLLDGNWRFAAPMNRHFAHVPARSLRGYRTAYPRTAKLLTDPAGGLASIEALYIALSILGRPTRGLLDGYHWREPFLAGNAWPRRPGGAVTPRASHPS